MERWSRLLQQQPPMGSWMSWLRFPRPGRRPLSVTVRGPYSFRPAPAPDPFWVTLRFRNNPMRERGDLFPESSARDPNIFGNLQQLSRSFWKIFGSFAGLFSAEVRVAIDLCRRM